MWAIALLGIGLFTLAGALLTLRLRRRGHVLCTQLAGLDDTELAGLGGDLLAHLDDELHDCAKQSDPATATAIGLVRRRIDRARAETGTGA